MSESKEYGRTDGDEDHEEEEDEVDEGVSSTPQLVSSIIRADSHCRTTKPKKMPFSSP